jgi:hypothetical protein
MNRPTARFPTARRTTALLLHAVTAVLAALALLCVARVALWLIGAIWAGLVS